MNVDMKVDSQRILLTTLKVRPIMVERVREAQAQDAQLSKIVEEVKSGSRDDFSLQKDGTLMIGERLCIPSIEDLKQEILEEAHCSTYSMHSGSTKMYRTL